MDRGPGRAALARGSKGGFGDGGRQNGAHSNPDTGRGYSAKLAGRTVFRERHRSIPVSGTDGSNPSPSSSESLNGFSRSANTVVGAAGRSGGVANCCSRRNKTKAIPGA